VKVFAMKYRMYVDEVGNSDLAASQNPNHRYLSLTGVIISLDDVKESVFPAIESLKSRYFNSHPDDPVIFHRKEMVNQRPPFDTLRNEEVQTNFNCELLALLTEFDYTVITTVLDKLEHHRKYQVWRFDPYHYCLTVLVERFAKWLERMNTGGDVMAESRGGKEDRQLKDSFTNVYESGTSFVAPEIIQNRLSSRQLKVKSKSNNIAGLQLADIIAHPSYRATLARHERQALPGNFGGQIAEILEREEYDRSPQGRIDGWGRKWLP
jgi:hypothetical protein